MQALRQWKKLVTFLIWIWSGGTQEANNKKTEGLLFWSKDVYAQKYIMSEKQVERTLLEMTGGDS